MKIAIFASSCLPFHGGTLDERPLGGTETGVIRLAAALEASGHAVTVYTAGGAHPPSKPKYLPFKAFDHGVELDLLVVVRDWRALFLGGKAKRRLLWTGDAHDQPANLGLGDRRVAARTDLLLTVSEWQRKNLAAASGFPIEKTAVLGNGVHLPYFSGSEKRIRKRLIYSATPFRGLALLPEIYLDLKRRHAELELHVFSGYDVYAGPSGPDPRAIAEFDLLREKLGKMPGCTVHGNVLQSVLAREFMRSGLFAYPNTFFETSCISAMEAQAAGCPIVTSALGALPETVGGAGALVKGTPTSPEYRAAFIAAAERLLTDEQTWQKCSAAGLKQAREAFDWNVVAKRFEGIVKDLEGKQ